MIIRRYLIKQVVSTTVVVLSILTLIVLGARLIKYFGIAAQGRLDIGVLFSIIGYRLPEFLILLIPLSFFIGLMLVFGRLYVDHEMAVFNSSGISKNKLGWLLTPLTIAVFLIELSLMLWVSPWGVREFNQLSSTQALRTGFDLVRPKEFISSGPYTIYASSLSEDRKNLKDIFVYIKSKQPDGPDQVILAKEATRVEMANETASIVDLTEGRRYEVYPNSAKYTQAEFKTWRFRIESKDASGYISKDVEGLGLKQLWENREDPVIASQLGWRIFTPFSIFVAVALAVALSEVTPRQGRYLKLFPALVIFASLIVLLIAAQTRISRGEFGIWLYPAIILFYLIAALLFSRRHLAPKIKHSIKQARS